MNQWHLAAEDARHALELEPNLLKGHFFRGLALAELENYEDAIKHIQKGKFRYFYLQYRNQFNLFLFLSTSFNR